MAPNSNEDSPEKPARDPREVKYGPQDKERLKSMGEFLVDVSYLTDLIHTHQQANQIDYILEFPATLLDSPVILPENSSFRGDGEIKITAGRRMKLPYINPVKQSSETEIPAFESDITVEIIESGGMLRAIRSSDGGEPSDELTTLNGQQKTSLTQAELNTLIMSLALPERNDYSLFRDIDLLENVTFGFLIETLRERSAIASTSGTYEFQTSNTAIDFTKINGDISFNATYCDVNTGDIITARSDAKKGTVLAFSLFKYGVTIDFPPDGEQSEIFNFFINKEIDFISQRYEPASSSSIIVANEVSTSISPADIENAIDEDAEMAHKLSDLLLDLELKDLEQDGFDSPDSSTT